LKNLGCLVFSTGIREYCYWVPFFGRNLGRSGLDISGEIKGVQGLGFERSISYFRLQCRFFSGDGGLNKRELIGLILALK